MKKSTATFKDAVSPSVFPKASLPFQPVPKADETAKPVKRDKIFSKSRDTREDRGTREMKTSHNAQTLPHGH